MAEEAAATPVVAFGRMLKRLGSSEFFYCQICLENQTAGGHRLEACGHEYCQECIAGYVASQVRDAQVYPRCFHREDDVACDVRLSDEDIRVLLGEEDVAKFEKFRFNKEHVEARQCPKCDHSQLGDPKSPAMQCDSCGASYCYTHGEAHPTGSCSDYEHSRRAEEKRNKALIAKTTKACPSCSAPISKESGCNQMKCPNCNTAWCWRCLAVVDDGIFPEHYQWWNIKGCPNGQMDEGASGALGRVIGHLQILVFGIPSLALTVVSAFLCCCFRWADSPKAMFSGALSCWGNCFSCLVAFGLIVAIFACPAAVCTVYFIPSALAACWRRLRSCGTAGNGSTTSEMEVVGEDKPLGGEEDALTTHTDVEEDLETGPRAITEPPADVEYVETGPRAITEPPADVEAEEDLETGPRGITEPPADVEYVETGPRAITKPPAAAVAEEDVMVAMDCSPPS